MSYRAGPSATLPGSAVAAFQGENFMSFEKDIAALHMRIARAEAERDSWRVAGAQEKYLEAYSMVEALTAQLDVLKRVARVQP